MTMIVVMSKTFCSKISAMYVCVCVHKGFYVVKHNINLKIFYPKRSSDFACMNFFYAFVSITFGM